MQMQSVAPQQYLNDLKWLLVGQELITADKPFKDFLKPDWQDIFGALVTDPEPLVEHMRAAKSHFLGTYFEQLFSFAVLQFSQLTILAEHEQVYDDKRTLGEVDLVAKDMTGKIWLFEVALKFYLERPDLAPNDWIGPNKNDSLLKKTTHARTHQLKILETGAGRHWLTTLTGFETYCSNLLIFGRLFPKMSAPSEESITKLHTGCGWMYLRDLPCWADWLEALQMANKPNWITPSDIEKSEFTDVQALHDTLGQVFENDRRPQLISCQIRKTPYENTLFWIFICPNSW